jgi:hypothetical protein
MRGTARRLPQPDPVRGRIPRSPPRHLRATGQECRQRVGRRSSSRAEFQQALAPPASSPPLPPLPALRFPRAGWPAGYAVGPLGRSRTSPPARRPAVAATRIAKPVPLATASGSGKIWFCSRLPRAIQPGDRRLNFFDPGADLRQRRRLGQLLQRRTSVQEPLRLAVDFGCP